MARNTSAMKRGWNWDAANNRIALMVNGVEVANFSSTVVTWNLAPLTLTYPLTHTGAVTNDTTLDVTGAATFAAAATVTGKLTANGSVDVGSAGIVAGVGTGANGIKLKNLKNAAASSLSGTQKDIEIDIGGTPYYFTCYPTKA